MQEAAIRAEGLVKRYAGETVVDGVDLEVPPGSVFALLGPNGAGKTTMIRMLATLAAPDEGSARVGGFDVVNERHKVRRRISLTGQFAAVDELATGYENLHMMARLGGLRPLAAKARAQELLASFDLTGAGRRRVSTYSGGMRRRLDLAASLVTRPKVLFLDEPTTGLDPRSRQGLWEAVRSLVASGVTVCLTTQYLEEADQLADRIALIDTGRIVAEGSPAQLKGRFSEQRVELSCVDAVAYESLRGRLATRLIASDAGRLLLRVSVSAADVRTLLDELDPTRRLLRSFEVRSASLDDVFLAVTGHHASPVSEKEMADV